MLINESLSMIFISPAHKLFSKHQSQLYMEVRWIIDMTNNQNADSFRLYLDLLAELPLQGSWEETGVKSAWGRMRTYNAEIKQ